MDFFIKITFALNSYLYKYLLYNLAYYIGNVNHSDGILFGFLACFFLCFVKCYEKPKKKS